MATRQNCQCSAVEKALEPHLKRSFSIPGLDYGSHEGFASHRLPELGWATCEWIRLDKAKANLANETLTALCEFVGCSDETALPEADLPGKHVRDVERRKTQLATTFDA